MFYHSVSHSNQQQANPDVPFFFYEAPHLANAFTLQLSEWPKLALARGIPQDGRIALPFNSHWLLKECENQWRFQRTSLQIFQAPECDTHPPLIVPSWVMDDDDDDALQQHLLAKLAPEANFIKPFCGPDFEGIGHFIIRDTDPQNGCHVLYNLGIASPYAVVSEGLPKVHSETPRSPRTLSAADYFDWLESQKVFCKGDYQTREIAPWQRVILCQGIAFGSKPDAKGKMTFLPIIVFNDVDDPIRIATDLHLSDKQRGGSEFTNPYSDPHNAFHITFFESIYPWPGTLLDHLRGSLNDLEPTRPYEYILWASRKLKLKIGHLYDRSQAASDQTLSKSPYKLTFRKSSFTVITTTRHAKFGTRSYKYPTSSDWYWTILILSPSGFFSPKIVEQQAIDVGQASHRTAELFYIVSALKKVEAQWRGFNEYIRSLLVEDFMDPAAYSKLLFDDATFSRSRLYFWILGCLHEFDLVIEDNIKQWRLYRQARIVPILDQAHVSPSRPSSEDPPTGSADHSRSSAEKRPEPAAKSTAKSAPPFDRPKDLDRLRALDKEGENICQSLKDLCQDFKVTQARVQALRDGLFNASALMESRSSTRLGMNVQLLTYVSIFYLPLAFCAALWAIPNITDSNTRSPFIAAAILVGFATYAIVFNLENIARFLGRAYSGQRDRLLEDMGQNPNESWRLLRERFEEFPPHEERKTPSEWWIIWYQTQRLVRRQEKKPGAFKKGNEPSRWQRVRQRIQGVFGKEQL